MKTTLASNSTTRTNSRRTSVDTVSEAVDVADTVVEARADGADERSIEGNEEEGLGEHDLLWEDGTSNNSMRTFCTSSHLVI